jgi:hypothetical protein
MTVDQDRADHAAQRSEPTGSWVELFPFVLFAVTVVATIVAIVATGDS